MVLAFKERFVIPIQVGAKIHTIREDKHDRWEAGKDIHFATGVRTPNYEQFHSGKCISVQKIQIIYTKDMQPTDKPLVFIDKRLQLPHQVELLANKDGFASARQFFKWFSEDFTGKIIHWTDYKY